MRNPGERRLPSSRLVQTAPPEGDHPSPWSGAHRLEPPALPLVGKRKHTQVRTDPLRQPWCSARSINACGLRLLRSMCSSNRNQKRAISRRNSTCCWFCAAHWMLLRRTSPSSQAALSRWSMKRVSSAGPWSSQSHWNPDSGLAFITPAKPAWSPSMTTLTRTVKSMACRLIQRLSWAMAARLRRSRSSRLDSSIQPRRAWTFGSKVSFTAAIISRYLPSRSPGGFE
jgi:hypothetical protein